ncbi:MAG: N-acetylglucosamine kinase [Bacteroidia bacterium]|nr:N-acetylglucosamine kinase [Bacteroidia bacterium]MCZ2277259.1 N-acetylglucosamine kinase [Bacteroidia bacterium]
MKLIVCDSGSTKADWIVAENGNIINTFRTIGFNPFFHNSDSVTQALNKNETALNYSDSESRIYFFGAGCSSPERQDRIKAGLKNFFTRAEITVEHDMLGAAIASCGDDSGLVCILGTGSNIAFYDGKTLSDSLHGLGYIMGDEGSGSYYGRKLISLFLYRIMPEDLRKDFFAKYGITKEVMNENVYNRPHANVYLASFAHFLSEHKNHEWIQQLVRKGMTEFFETNIISYPEYKTYPVHFIGSIAYYFSDILNSVADMCGFRSGKILIRPIDEILNYYLARIT